MKRFFLAATTAAVLLATPVAIAGDSLDGKPSSEAMIFDLAIARPIGLVGTIAGAAIFVIALPISITIGAPPAAAAKRLVVEPFNWTFTRPLGES